jgi:spore germination protein YaaH
MQGAKFRGMRIRRTIVVALVACAAALGAGTSKKPAITTLMYLVNRPDSIASFRAHAERISIVAPQSFSMDEHGFVMGEVPPEVMRIARENRVAVTPLVTNRGFRQPLMHTVLDTPEARARAIRYLIYYALRDGYQGFQFDYENIHYTYRDKFTLFFREAAREFHRHGLELSAAVVGRLDDTRNSNSPGGYDNWSGVYDYAAMGKVADYISVMAYAEHGNTADPGPVAGMPWVTKIAKYSAETIPPRKVSLGVPFYAQRWEAVDPASQPADQRARKWRGRSARYRDAAAAMTATAAVWDEQESAPHLSFQTEGRATELWYEDARSLGAKMRLAHDMGFRGVSAWVLGQEDPAFWDSLDAWEVRHPSKLLREGTLDERSRQAARQLAVRR